MVIGEMSSAPVREVTAQKKLGRVILLPFPVNSSSVSTSEPRSRVPQLRLLEAQGKSNPLLEQLRANRDNEHLSTEDRFVSRRLASLEQTFDQFQNENLIPLVNQRIQSIQLQSVQPLSLQTRYQVLIETAYENEKVRNTMISEIDQITRRESDTIAKQGELRVPVLIIGCGVVGSEAIMSLPIGFALGIDMRPHRGGQFARKGIEYPLNINPNPNNHPVFLQPVDPNTNTTTNVRFANAMNINTYLHSVMMVDAQAENITLTQNVEQPYAAQLTYTNSQGEKKQVKIISDKVILAPGNGTPTLGKIDITQSHNRAAIETGRVYNSDQFYEEVGQNHSPEALSQMITEGLAIVGSGDTTIAFITDILSEVTKRPDLVHRLITNQKKINVYGSTSELDFMHSVRKVPHVKELLHYTNATVNNLGVTPTDDIQVAFTNMPDNSSSSQLYHRVSFLTGFDASKVQTVLMDSYRDSEGRIIQLPLHVHKVGRDVYYGQLGTEGIYVAGYNGTIMQKIAQTPRGQEIRSSSFIIDSVPSAQAVSQVITNQMAV